MSSTSLAGFCPLPPALRQVAAELLENCRRQGLVLATAESCTGGLIGAALTAIAGSSDVFDRGFVTYSNQAKNEVLGVSKRTLASHGAVSEPAARAMAEGAIERSRAHLAVAVTGIAGPGGGSPDKPVGLVHFAVARKGAATTARHKVFPGDRDEVRAATVAFALELLTEAAGGTMTA